MFENTRHYVGHIKMKDYLETHIATNREIQTTCGLSERQVLRELTKLGDRVVKIASGRRPKYALTKNAFAAGDRLNIWEVDAQGKHSCIAVLRPLSVGGFFVEKLVGGSSLLLGEAGNGLYDDLPFFLRDMAPQGFLGRKIARELNQRDSDFPGNPEYWSNEHIGQYLLSNNDYAMGDLKLGNSANLRLKSSFSLSTPQAYPALAEQVLSEDSPMSSAGGEQPKFVSYCMEKEQHVIVKFSPKGDGESAQRWRDILISEHYANELINSDGVLTAASSTLIEKEGRLFLESIRFDRHAKHGRSSMLSLKSIDAEFVGSGESWVSSLTGLYKMELLSEQDLFNGQCLWLFGRLINNTDMHLGNMSLGLHGEVFNLLPIYDMCSMGFAPKNNGEVMPFTFAVPDIPKALLDSDNLEWVQKMAGRYWRTLLVAPEISDEFRAFLTEFVSRGL